MPSFGLLKDKVALVTGSGRGIGRAIALRFASEGAKVVVNDRTETEIQSTYEMIKADGGCVLGISCDIRNENQVERMIQTVVQRWGAIDILVNNAAVFPERVPFPKVEFKQWHEVIDVNLCGAYRCAHAVVREMIRKKTAGRIINISSINAFRYRRSTYGQTQYNISKAALDSLTKGLAMELAQYGIIVNGIAPGFVRTSMSAADSLDEPEFKKEYLESGRIPLGRYGTPEDCASLAVFLASDECTWMTGETIIQDGGMHITF